MCACACVCMLVACTATAAPCLGIPFLALLIIARVSAMRLYELSTTRNTLERALEGGEKSEKAREKQAVKRSAERRGDRASSCRRRDTDVGGNGQPRPMPQLHNVSVDTMPHSMQRVRRGAEDTVDAVGGAEARGEEKL